MNRFASALQTLLMEVMSLCARGYVSLSPLPMRLEIRTTTRHPVVSPEDDTPELVDPVHVQWLEELYRESPGE